MTKSVKELITTEEMKLIKKFTGAVKMWSKEFKGFDNVYYNNLMELVKGLENLKDAYKDKWSNNGYFLVYEAKHHFTAVKELYRQKYLKAEESGAKTPYKRYIKKYEYTFEMWELLYDAYQR